MPRLDLVDISAAQTISDPAAIPALRAMAIQVGWSWEGKRAAGEMRLNSKLAGQVKVARDRGLPVIWYFVPVYGTPLDKQIATWLAAIGPLGPNDGMMLDVEFGQNYEWMRQWTDAQLNGLLERMRAHLGRPVFIYGDEGFMRQAPAWAVRWAAHYGARPGDESERAAMVKRYAGIRVGMWQWAGATGRCPGFAGAVDCNEVIDEAGFREAMGMAQQATGFSHNPALTKAWLDSTIVAARPIIRPRGIVAHTIVNSGNVTWQAFRAACAIPDNTKAQYVDRDGGAYEILPPDRKFAASWQGDRFQLAGAWRGHIPYETEDELGAALGPYTPDQRDALIRAWLQDCLMWDIPAVVPKVGDWTAAGIHYHSLHGLNTHHQTKPATDPFGFNYYDSARGYWVRVVNPLTKTVGKTCPGAEKIAQHAAMVAEVRAQLTGGGQLPIPEPAPKEADVDLIRPDGATAVFARAGTVSWVQGPQVATFRSLYGDPKPVKVEDLKLYGLVGPMPVGDTRPWVPTDFAWVAGQKGDPGEKGDKGDPGEGVAPGTVIPGEFKVAG